jgi:hypothetical protein
MAAGLEKKPKCFVTMKDLPFPVELMRAVHSKCLSCPCNSANLKGQGDSSFGDRDPQFYVWRRANFRRHFENFGARISQESSQQRNY